MVHQQITCRRHMRARASRQAGDSGASPQFPEGEHSWQTCKSYAPNA